MVANFTLHSFIFLKGLKSWGHSGGGAERTKFPEKQAWPGLGQRGGEGVLARCLNSKLP